MVGGKGVNTVDYSGETQGIAVDLAAKSTTGAETGTDSLTGVSVVIAGSGNDSLSGDQHDNTLMGGDGNDALTGGNGEDLLDGGAGADMFVYTSALGAAQSTGKHHDTITGFDVAAEHIDLWFAVTAIDACNRSRNAPSIELQRRHGSGRQRGTSRCPSCRAVHALERLRGRPHSAGGRRQRRCRLPGRAGPRDRAQRCDHMASFSTADFV